MAFPLVVNPVSAGLDPVEVWGADTYGAVVLTWDIDFTRTTSWGTLFTHDRSVAVEPILTRREYDLQLDLDVTFRHVFTGIGGVRYIPSFPQWDREQTSFPFAF